MIGQSIGAYRIVAKLGEGGMGAVYLGEHQRIARSAAIKVLLPEFSANAQIVARFFNEARSTSLIRHPGIVDIIDCDVLPTGNAYIVMECLEGESLGSYLRRGERMSVQRAVLLARHLAEALAAAHEAHIVHRDLKPDNVFLLPARGDAASQPVKILDFGIAKLMQGDANDGHLKTRTGVILGTPVYMSPEQCRGVGEIDHRTDIYSLGCILFEMIVGRPPFTSEGFGELIQSHLSIAPPTLRSFDRALPAAIDMLVARMLAKSPEERPQTMRALVAELDAAVLGQPEMTVASPRQRGTMLLDVKPIPRAQTTLRSASAEKIQAVHDDGAPAILKVRRWALVLGGSAAALVLGGVWIWRSSVDVPSRALVHAAESSAPPAPTLPKELPPSVPAAPPASATLVVATLKRTARSPEVAAVKPPHPSDEAVGPSPAAPTIRRVRVVLTSEPSGADVCLAKDRILLGRTRFDWKPEKSSHVAKLLIRKRGYRGEELAIAVEHDTRKEVKLGKLGPDDLDDLDTCEKSR